jgi:hypothetical protein
MEFTNFIKIEVVIPHEGENGETLYHVSKACLNPNSVSYYYPTILKGRNGDVTCICVGGSHFYGNFSFEEFDLFFITVERGIKITSSE